MENLGYTETIQVWKVEKKGKLNEVNKSEHGGFYSNGIYIILKTTTGRLHDINNTVY